VLEFALADLGTEAFVAHYLRARGGDPAVTAEIQAAADREAARQEEIKARLLRDAHVFFEPPQRVGIVYGGLPKNTGLHELLTGRGCVVAVNLRPSGHLSIRSLPEAPVSHLIGQDFRGGGHAQAAGGDLKLRGLRLWWYALRRGRGWPMERLAESAQRHLKALAAPRSTSPKGRHRTQAAPRPAARKPAGRSGKTTPATKSRKAAKSNRRRSGA
ncbi:MAG TPA: hypothetical protein VI796_05905, partial [Candidatus Thermoplasmatota archaeon]|nr:hypothetical protein [Candidatus Thermoplasmatota archaeon]